MNSELYTAASGLIAEERRLELIANNLANSSTAGYRALRSFFEVYRGVAAGAPGERREANTAVAIAGTWEAPGPGPVRPTGRALDVALPADGLLAVRAAGGRRYTRAGSLAISSRGELTDALGHPVLDAEGQPLSGLGPGARIADDGRVLDGDGEIGKLMVVRYDPALLERAGNNLLSARGDDRRLEPIDDPELRPGYLEGATGDPVLDLVELIEAQRAFQSYQKIISLTMNEVNRRAVNDIAGR